MNFRYLFSMKNYNIPANVTYAIIGAILGVAISLSGTILIEYIGSIQQKPLVQEFSMVFLFFATPTLFITGLILGIIYARKYKK